MTNYKQCVHEVIVMFAQWWCIMEIIDSS